MMTIKNGKVKLTDFPTEEELAELNTKGDFILCVKRGYKRLLQITNKNDIARYCEHECPIGQTFTI